MVKKSYIFLSSCFVIIFIIGVMVYINYENRSQNSSELDQDVNIKQLVHNYSTGNFTNVQASITGTELIVIDDKNNERIYPLPDDEFFVSIAPFISVTHPCTFHSLTGCQGELVEEDFHIYIEDLNGNIIFDDEISSLANGFIDLWLPRNDIFKVSIFYNDMIAQSEISTFDDDATCITTMQLL